jgi:hypothetical protein
VSCNDHLVSHAAIATAEVAGYIACCWPNADCQNGQTILHLSLYTQLVVIAMAYAANLLVFLAERPQSSASNHAKVAVGASAFDILPTRGMLNAGESRTVEFAYYARPGQKASTNAVCEVEGGPTYTLPVTADSNAIKYVCLIGGHAQCPDRQSPH